ncbi:MAG: hypothetical protein FWC56_00715 [Phycisphaerae bacterium]|nr:hypothetical protein [Phycisphaerae bacterium]
MNAQQKQAWLVVIVVIVSLVGYLLLLPFVGPKAAGPVFGLLGFAGLGPRIFRRKPIDERDRSIHKEAALVAAGVSYGIFVLGCIGVWLIAFGWLRQEQIAVHLLMLIFVFGAIALVFVHSVTLLILYARHSGGEDA